MTQAKLLICQTPSCKGQPACASRDPKTGAEVLHTAGSFPDSRITIMCVRCGRPTTYAVNRLASLPDAS